MKFRKDSRSAKQIMYQRRSVNREGSAPSFNTHLPHSLLTPSHAEWTLGEGRGLVRLSPRN